MRKLLWTKARNQIPNSMGNYSLTTTSLYAMGIAFILRAFNVDFVEGDIDTVVQAGAVVALWIGAIVGRLRKGDLTIFGKRVKTLNPQ